MNFKDGLITVKAFECFTKDFEKEKTEIPRDYLVSPSLMRTKLNTYLNELIFNEVKGLKSPALK